MLEKYNITQTTLKILGLYTNNYKKSLHLREISRQTKVDVKAIQLQLKKLEAINILSSTIRGKNKEYTLNQGNISAKYYLSMAEVFTTVIYLQKNFLLKKIISEIDHEIDDPIILFGSFAKKNYTKESDIDLFVISDKKINRNMVLETSRLVNHDINIKTANKQQFLNGLKKKDPLIHEIIFNHVVLKGADTVCDILWEYYAAQ